MLIINIEQVVKNNRLSKKTSENIVLTIVILMFLIKNLKLKRELSKFGLLKKIKCYSHFMKNIRVIGFKWHNLYLIGILLNVHRDGKE